MSFLHLNFNKCSQIMDLGDGQDLNFGFDKRFYSKNYYDLLDFAIFFKFKDFRDFSIFEREYQEYQDISSRIRSWIFSYKKLGMELKSSWLIPPQMASQFIRAQASLLGRFHEEIRNNYIYNSFVEYYSRNQHIFNVIRDLKYEINSTEGLKNVELVFAENFRFKPESGSYNLFILPKNMRDTISAREDGLIYMIDFSQFEFRTFLRVTNADIDFTSNSIYEDIGLIAELQNPKLELIADLYSEYENDKIKKVIDKSVILDSLNNDWFKFEEIPVYIGHGKRNKKIHTIIQTISYFYYLDKLSKVITLLKGKQSKFIFPLHDAMIFDIHKSELYLLEEINDILQDSIYKIKSYVGKNLKEVERIYV